MRPLKDNDKQTLRALPYLKRQVGRETDKLLKLQIQSLIERLEYMEKHP